MDYLEVNRRNWDERAAIHAGSDEYALSRFGNDPGHLSDVVRFDASRLGDISGQRVVHLQCHIGTDTLSLARLGADVTGLDLSPQSLAVARELAGDQVTFVEADVYSAREVLDGQFDLVYTGIGALCWLPDIDRWAETVASLLRPGGRLFIREGHPVLWALEYDDANGELKITYPYFTTEEPIIETVETSYAGTGHTIRHATTHSWNHGLGEIITAVLDHGMTLTAFEEHRSVPWEPLPDMLEVDQFGEYHLKEHGERLPMTYTLQAVKR